MYLWHTLLAGALVYTPIELFLMLRGVALTLLLCVMWHDHPTVYLMYDKSRLMLVVLSILYFTGITSFAMIASRSVPRVQYTDFCFAVVPKIDVISYWFVP
jgi:hypothetical protein